MPLVDELQKHVGLIALTICWPKLGRRVDNASVQIDEANEHIEIPDELRTSPQWKLIPTEWGTRLRSFETQTRQAVRNSCLSFGVAKGTFLMPWSRADEVLGQLAHRRVELCGDENTPGLAQQFIDGWPDHVEDLRTKLHPDTFAKVKRKLPSVSELRAKFDLRTCIIPLAGEDLGVTPVTVYQWISQLENVSDVPSSLLENMRQAAEQAERNALADTPLADARSLAHAAREQLHAYVQEHVAAMAHEPRRRLAEALAHVEDMCRGGNRRMKQNSLRRIRDAYDYLKGFAFLADEELLRRMDAVQHEMDAVDPSTLNSNDNVANAFANTLSSAIDHCRDQRVAEAQVQRFTCLEM